MPMARTKTTGDSEDASDVNMGDSLPGGKDKAPAGPRPTQRVLVVSGGEPASRRLLIFLLLVFLHLVLLHVLGHHLVAAAAGGAAHGLVADAGLADRVRVPVLGPGGDAGELEAHQRHE